MRGDIQFVGTGKRRWLTHLMLIVTCLIVGFPLLYAILLATQSNPQILSRQLLPGGQLLENLRFILIDRNIGLAMWNSTLQAVLITVGKTIFSLLAGLAFVYFRFPGKWILFGFVLITLMMPTEIMILALFRIVSGFGWGDSMVAITVPFLASATGAFLFRQHFASLPGELSEAAQLDGANPLQFLWHILIPVSWNTIGALTVIQFVYVWHMYLWPLMINRSDSLIVIQVALEALSGIEATEVYSTRMTGAVLASIPPLIVFLLLQKQFMSGFAVTRDK